jgi:hypothetical protein
MGEDDLRLLRETDDVENVGKQCQKRFNAPVALQYVVELALKNGGEPLGKVLYSNSMERFLLKNS